MARLKEIDPDAFSGPERKNHECVQCACVTFREVPAEPEQILPSGRDLWEMKMGRQAVNTEHCYALRQQTTVEAICVWLEKIAHRQCWTKGIASDMCRILRADAERVVREAGGGE